MKINNIVAFLILMQGNAGVLNKSPDYIMEKFERYCLSNKYDEFTFGLDGQNTLLLEAWRQRWDKEYKALMKLKQ